MVRAITLDEYTRLLASCELYSHLDKYLRLAAISGLRVSEVLTVTLGQLYDFETAQAYSTLTIKKKNLKYGKKSGSTVAARYIKLPDYFKQYIIDYIIRLDKPTTSTKFITVSDERIRQLLDTAVAKTLPEALGEPISTHSIRKMYAVLAYEKSDKSLATVQAMLGHKNISSTGHYLTETINKVGEITQSVQDMFNTQ